MVHKFELIDLCCKSFFLRCFLVLVNNTAVYSFPVRNLKTVLSSYPSHCPRPLSSRYSLSVLPPIHYHHLFFVSSAYAPNQTIIDCLLGLPVLSLAAVPPVHPVHFCQQASEKPIMLASLKISSEIPHYLTG